jgi:hypothetical protein
MRECIVPALILLSAASATAQTVPSGWKLIRDTKAACQIAVPPDWSPFSEASGAAIFHDPSTAIAVVTSQPGQAFKPLTPAMLKMLGIPKEKVFENSAVRLFYQDRTSEGPEDEHAFTASAPGNGGTCSCRVVFLPKIPVDTARKIVLSLGPAPATN